MTQREWVEDTYRRFGHSVFRRALRILGSDADARDIVQELFSSLLEHPHQFQGNSTLMTWLYRATTNACLNRLRNARHRLRLVTQEAAVRPDGADGLQGLTHDVQALLLAMPEEWATALIYSSLDQMSHAEIAEVLGCSRRHVGDVLTRARAWAAQPENQR